MHSFTESSTLKNCVDSMIDDVGKPRDWITYLIRCLGQLWSVDWEILTASGLSMSWAERV